MICQNILENYQNIVALCFKKISDHFRLENIDNYKFCQEDSSIFSYLPSENQLPSNGSRD